MDKKSAVEAALLLISKRSYSSKSLSDKLLSKGYSPDETRLAVERLKEMNYINDEHYAKILAEHLSRNAKGEYYIKAELEKHAIAPDIIRNTLKAASEEEPYAQIIAILERKFPAFSNNNAAEKRKTAAFFTRRGFKLDDILKAFRRINDPNKEI
jgi:regulatory protein